MTGAKKSRLKSRSALPLDVPAVAEQGDPGFDVPTWFSLDRRSMPAAL